MNIVQALGGTTKTKDKMSDLHDKITLVTRAAGPSGATGTQEQKWGEWGDDIVKSLDRRLQEAEASFRHPVPQALVSGRRRRGRSRS